MGEYNPRQITQMRWKDAKDLEHLIFKAIDISFNDNSSIKLSDSLEAKQLVNRIKYCYDNQVPLIIYEYANDKIFVATNFGDCNEVWLHNLNINVNETLDLVYDGQDTLSMSVKEDTFLTAANASKMYRHQLTITNQSNVSVTYIVNASNGLVIDTLEKFVAVTKANADYAGLASYQDASNHVQPAFIRYSAGNVIIQLQNGSVSPMKSISDIVTPI